MCSTILGDFTSDIGDSILFLMRNLILKSYSGKILSPLRLPIPPRPHSSGDRIYLARLAPKWKRDNLGRIYAISMVCAGAQARGDASPGRSAKPGAAGRREQPQSRHLRLL